MANWRQILRDCWRHILKKPFHLDMMISMINDTVDLTSKLLNHTYPEILYMSQKKEGGYIIFSGRWGKLVNLINRKNAISLFWKDDFGGSVIMNEILKSFASCQKFRATRCWIHVPISPTVWMDILKMQS